MPLDLYNFCQDRDKRVAISRSLENEMTVKVQAIRAPCVAFVPCCFSKQSEEPAALPMWCLQQTTDVTISSVCFVIGALQIGWIPKCCLNLISLLTGDWLQGPLSVQPGSLESSFTSAQDLRKLLRLGLCEDRQLSWIAVNIFLTRSYFSTLMEEGKGEDLVARTYIFHKY